MVAEGVEEGKDLRFPAASVLFADIRNFTSLAERLEPRDTVDMLNEIFTELFEAVSQSDGMLDKFIGDARLEKITKVYQTGVVICEETAQAVGATHALRELDLIRVKGRERPARIFQVLTPQRPVDAAALEAYAKGREALAERRWQDAATAFDAAVRADPADHPSALMLERARNLVRAPPALDWDGVWGSEDNPLAPLPA